MSTNGSQGSVDHQQLQTLAKRHLLMHFTRHGSYEHGEVPVIARGDGCYLYDSTGKRFFDGLSGLFCTQIGYGFGEELGEAAKRQMEELPFHINWSYAHPRSIELAAKVAELAPGDLNRVFFVSGGSEANESIIKLVKQYHQLHGHSKRYKMIARRIAYHGTTLGALSLTGIAPLRAPFEPLMPGVRHVSNTNRYRRPEGETEEEFTDALLTELRDVIEQEGPESVAAVFMEPVQNSGGTFTPPKGYFQGVRAICDEHGILMVADEVICGFGRLGAWFGSEKYDIRPDIVTSAKGLSSAYASIGAVITTDRVFEPFASGTAMFTHGITFGGHPVMCAIALKNIEIMKRERIVEHVADTADTMRASLATLQELPIVGDLRGTGFFYALELVKDKETRESFDEDESETLLRGFLSGALWDRGLICRADDRGDPVVQISPPLVAGQAEIDEITGILGDVLSEASDRLHGGKGPSAVRRAP